MQCEEEAVAKFDLGEEEFADLVGEVLEELARDPRARHLWHWASRPGCEDEPPGRSRRNHLGALLGLVGATVLPSACSSRGIAFLAPIRAVRR